MKSAGQITEEGAAQIYPNGVPRRTAAGHLAADTRALRADQAQSLSVIHRGGSFDPAVVAAAIVVLPALVIVAGLSGRRRRRHDRPSAAGPLKPGNTYYSRRQGRVIFGPRLTNQSGPCAQDRCPNPRTR